MFFVWFVVFRVVRGLFLAGSDMIRRRIWEVVEIATPGDGASRVFDLTILTLIFLNVLATILGTVSEIHARFGVALDQFEVLSVAVFTVEYLTRLWACRADERYDRLIVGRLLFAKRGLLLIDLMAILPFYLPFVGIDLRSFRVLRLLRILRIVRIGRYYNSLYMIHRVVRAKREELVLTSAVMFLLLVVSASVLFYCEHDLQPDSFSSIPATMWWAIATLTTVGYGDMYPITVLGRLFASVIAVLGIGMFALPTGILGAAFVEEIERSKNEARVCPHCGKPIH